MTCPTCQTGEHDFRDLGPVSVCECCQVHQTNY